MINRLLITLLLPVFIVRSFLQRALRPNTLTLTRRRCSEPTTSRSISQRKRNRRAEAEKDKNTQRSEVDIASFEADLQRLPNESAAAVSTFETGLEQASESLRFYGFDELFPGRGLSDLFDSSSSFRRDIRDAARDDFFVPDERLSAQVFEF